MKDGRLPPRAIVVTRLTELEELLRRHGTREQARFFLASRGRRIEEVEEKHRVLRSALDAVLAAIPLRWRRALVSRSDLDRFLFEPEDIVLAVGQDGLVANAAKYLRGQIVIGINPSRALFDGVLVRHDARHARELMQTAAEGRGRLEARTMAEASTPDGQRLVALNEIYVGHRSHQSSRYTLRWGEHAERQSSSGIVIATGTGATGWARSIAADRGRPVPLPSAGAHELAFFVREAFPSVGTGRMLTEGTIGADLEISSEMNEGGVAFGDGIEDDAIDLFFGQEITLRAASHELRLMTG